jgi:hypothetical protein
MSREAPTSGTANGTAETNGEAPKPTLQRRPSYTLLGSPDPAPIVLTAAAVLAFCAGCTNACAMLGVFMAPGIRASQCLNQMSRLFLTA